MVRIVARYSAFFLVLSLISTLVALAQTDATGSLTGTVTDQQGGLIPSAVVLAKNDRTGSAFRAVTNQTGVWEISSVPAGIYTVSVTAQAFRTATFRDINMESGGTRTVDATLQIGLSDSVTVSASKFEQEVINAPATVSIIPEQAIEVLPTQNLADLLRDVSGMNVVQTSAASFGVNGRAASAALTGAQLVLVDGRTVYMDSYGYVPWNLIPTSLDNIKQMEVVRGPASAIWGANAMNGVINIITAPPREMSGTTFTLGVGTFDRSGGIAESNRGSLYYANITHAQAINDRWAFRITGGGYTQDAFARPKDTRPNILNLYPSPTFANKGTTQPKAEARFDYDFPDGMKHLTFSGGYASSTGIWHGSSGGILADMSSAYGKVDYVRGAMRISGYTNYFATDGPFLIRFTPSGQHAPWSDHNHTYHFEVSDLRKVWERHLLSFGGNVRYGRVNFSAGIPVAEDHSEVGAYVQDEIELSQHFRWLIGSRVDKFDNLKDATFSPRMTFIIKPTPGQTFRVSYNQAYMAPTWFSNYVALDWMSWWNLGPVIPELEGYSHPVHLEGNRNLKAPSLSAYEVGYMAAFANDRVHFGGAFYINDTRHDIYYQQMSSYTSQNPPPGWPLPPFVLDLPDWSIIFGPGNGLLSLAIAQNQKDNAKTRNEGIELDLDARLSRAIDVFANYSWQAKPIAEGFDASGINLPPPHRFNAGLNFDHKRYSGNVSVGYVGRAYWQDISLFGGFTDAYTTINFSTGVRLDAKEKFTVWLKVSNLGNALIQNHIYGDVLKRQITGEFKMRFHK